MSLRSEPAKTHHRYAVDVVCDPEQTPMCHVEQTDRSVQNMNTVGYLYTSALQSVFGHGVDCYNATVSEQNATVCVECFGDTYGEHLPCEPILAEDLKRGRLGPPNHGPPEGRFTWGGQGLDSSNTVEIRFFILIRFDACREHKVSGPVCQSCLQNCSFLLQKIPNACRGAYRMESDRSTGIKTSRVEVVVVRTEIGMFQSPRTATRVPFVSLLFRLRNNNTNQLVENAPTTVRSLSTMICCETHS